MSISKNRCSGCTQYDGFRGDTAICKLGNIASIENGCSSFDADIDASCHSECFYYSGRDKLSNIKCAKYNETYSSEKQYCVGYAEKWEGMSSSNSSSSSRSGCFPKGTQILTGNNITTCISLLKKGDLVATANDNNKIQIEKILKINLYKNKQLWEIVFTDGESLKTTHSHSFFNGTDWLKASEITTGDLMYFYEKGNFKKKEVGVSSKLPIVEDVYNIIVDKNYTFIANGMLSHSFTYFRNYRKLYWSILRNLDSLSLGISISTLTKNCYYLK